MNKKLKIVVTLFLILTMLFGVMSTTVLAAGTSTGDDEESSSPIDKLETGWCEISYDSKGITVTLNPDVKSLLDVNEEEIREVVSILVDAIKTIVVEDLKNDILGTNNTTPVVSDGEGDGEDTTGTTGSLDGFDFESIFGTALDGYVAENYKKADYDGYIAFMKAVLNDATVDDELTDENADLSIEKFIDFACGLIRIPVLAGEIKPEELPEAGEALQNTLIEAFDKKINEYIDQAIETLLPQYASDYLDDIVNEGKEGYKLKLDKSIRSIIDTTVAGYIKDEVLQYIDNGFKVPEGSDDPVDSIVGAYTDKQIKVKVKGWISDYGEGKINEIPATIYKLIDDSIVSLVENFLVHFAAGTIPDDNPIYSVANAEIDSLINQYKDIFLDPSKGSIPEDIEPVLYAKIASEVYTLFLTKRTDRLNNIENPDDDEVFGENSVWLKLENALLDEVVTAFISSDLEDMVSDKLPEYIKDVTPHIVDGVIPGIVDEMIPLVVEAKIPEIVDELIPLVFDAAMLDIIDNELIPQVVDYAIEKVVDAAIDEAIDSAISEFIVTEIERIVAETGQDRNTIENSQEFKDAIENKRSEIRGGVFSDAGYELDFGGEVKVIKRQAIIDAIESPDGYDLTVNGETKNYQRDTIIDELRAGVEYTFTYGDEQLVFDKDNVISEINGDGYKFDYLENAPTFKKSEIVDAIRNGSYTFEYGSGETYSKAAIINDILSGDGYSFTHDGTTYNLKKSDIVAAIKSDAGYSLSFEVGGQTKTYSYKSSDIIDDILVGDGYSFTHGGTTYNLKKADIVAAINSEAGYTLTFDLGEETKTYSYKASQIVTDIKSANGYTFTVGEDTVTIKLSEICNSVKDPNGAGYTLKIDGKEVFKVTYKDVYDEAYSTVYEEYRVTSSEKFDKKLVEKNQKDTVLSAIADEIENLNPAERQKVWNTELDAKQQKDIIENVKKDATFKSIAKGEIEKMWLNGENAQANRHSAVNSLVSNPAYEKAFNSFLDDTIAEALGRVENSGDGETGDGETGDGETGDGETGDGDVNYIDVIKDAIEELWEKESEIIAEFYNMIRELAAEDDNNGGEAGDGETEEKSKFDVIKAAVISKASSITSEDLSEEALSQVFSSVLGKSKAETENKIYNVVIPAFIKAYGALRQELIEAPDLKLDYKELIKYIKFVKINDIVLYEDGMVTVESIRALLATIPTPEEIKDMSNEEMQLSYTVTVATTLNTETSITLTARLGGGHDKVRRFAKLFCEYVDYSIGEGNVLNLKVKVPARFAELALKAINYDDIPEKLEGTITKEQLEKLKKKVFDAIDESPDDVYALLKDVTLDDLLTLFNYVDVDKVIDKMLDVEFISKFEKLDGLTEEDIKNRIKDYEEQYNKLVRIAKRLYADRVPDDLKTATIFSLYDGSGKFSVSGSKAVNIEKLLNKFDEEKGALIASFINVTVIEARINAEIEFEQINKVTYKLDGEVYKTGFLPAGADLAFFAGITSHDGEKIKGWRGDDGVVYTTMPDKDIVLEPEYDIPPVLEAPEVEISGGLEEPKVYDGEIVVLKAKLKNGMPSNFKTVEYQWYELVPISTMSLRLRSTPVGFTEVLIPGQTGETLTLKNVGDSGNYFCELTFTDKNGNQVTARTETSTVHITQAPSDLIDPPVAVEGLIFNNAPQALVVPGSAEGGTMVYRIDGENTFSTEIPKATNAGTYTIHYWVEGGENYETKPGGTVTVVIDKKVPEFTAPTLIDGFEYDNVERELLATLGVAESGTLLYKVNGGQYSETPPTAKLAGTYEVYVKVESTDNNYYGISERYVGTVTVSATDDFNVVAPAPKTLVYDGTVKDLIDAGFVEIIGSTVNMEYKLEDGEYSSAIPTATEAGTYRVHYRFSLDANYGNAYYENYVDVTVAKAQQTFTQLPEAIVGLVYDGSSKTLINAGSASNGTMKYRFKGVGGYSVELPTAIMAGQYTIEYMSDGGNNYENIYGELSVAIDRAESAYEFLPAAKQNLVYNGGAQILVAPGSTLSNCGTVVYKLSPDADYSPELPKAVHSGSYTVYYKIAGDANHLDSAEGQFTVVIDKYTIDFTGYSWKPTEFVYDGTEKAVYLVNENGDILSYGLKYFGNVGVNAGTYTATVGVLDSNNFRIAEGSGFIPGFEWVIKPATLDMSGVSFNNKTVKYDGNNHSIFITGTLPAGVTVTYSENSFKDPGTYIVTATFNGGSNYVLPVQSLTATLKILGFKNTHEAYNPDDNKLIIRVDSEKGVSENQELRFHDVTAMYINFKFGDIFGEGYDGVLRAAYDIYFAEDGNQQTVSDNFTVRLLIPVSLRSSANQLKVVHIADNGDVEDMNATRDGDYMVFDTTHFSVYSIVEVVEKSAVVDPGTDDEKNYTWLWILLAVILLLIIAAIVVFIIVRKNNKDTEPKPEAEETVVAEAVEETAPTETEEAVVTEEPAAEEPAAEEPVAEEPVAEAPIAPVITLTGKDSGEAIVNGEVVHVRYRTSFMSRLIQSEEDIQNYYTALKNALLSYKGVKARVSWNFESFNKGRVQCAKLNIKGNALQLYLALDPKEYNANKYHFVDVADKPKLDQVPMMLKVKSDRALKYALELIEEMMNKLGMERIETPSVDYRMPYETTEDLAARGLVKIILPAGVTLDGDESFVKVNVGEMLDSAKSAVGAVEPTVEEPVVEVPAIEEPVEEAPIAPAITLNDNGEAIVNGEVVQVRYRTSFMSRLIQSGDVMQTYYTAIKNALLSYKGVKARESWNFESFNKGRVQCAKLNVKGTALQVYLALDPNEYSVSKYHFVDVANKPKLDQVPMMLKVKSARGLKSALELIEEMMAKLGIEKGKASELDFHMPYETTEALAARDLVKVILPKGVKLDGGENIVKVNVGEMLDNAKAQADAEKEEPVVVEPTVEEPAVEEPTEELIHADATHADEILTDDEAKAKIEVVERVPGEIGQGKLFEINLDTICENFEDGETVTLEALKAKRLVNKNAGRIKVLARGTMTKKLTVCADKFSLQAVKMITLAGGHADQYK